MKPPKEECLKALEICKQLINEHFDNNMARTCQNLVSEINKLEKTYQEVLEDNELLNKENEKLKRKILGMQQTISNQKQQLESHYKSLR